MAVSIDDVTLPPASRVRGALWLVLGVALIGGLVFVGNAKREQPSQQPVVQPRVASSAEWAALGTKIDADKAAQRARGGESAAGTTNMRAVRTAPVDVDHDGNYVVRAGPMTLSEYDDRIAVFYPEDTDFTARLGSFKLVRAGDSYFLEATLTVRGVTAPYPGYNVWIA